MTQVKEIVADPVSEPMSKEERKRMKKLKKKESREKSESGEKLSKEDRKKQKKEKKRKRKAEEQETEQPKKTKANGPYQQPMPTDKSFKKSFYQESDKTGSMTQEKQDQFHTENEMTVSGTNCSYKPILSFDAAPFTSDLMKSCKGFEKPTPIQSQCWPILSSGRDIIGIAQTGSGKTLAFTLPGLIHIKDQEPVSRKSKGPIMLVIAPTRELAIQSSEVIEAAGSACGIRSVCIYGGVPKHEQRKKLREGVHVVVATPGRLKDLVEDNSCDLSRVTYLVLDEADRMLDEGFERDIRLLIGCAHKERQIAMFSATWPKCIQELAHEFLVDSVKVTCGSDDLVASRSITQIVEVVDDYTRDNKVNQLLKEYHSSRKNRVLVFVLYKKEAVRVERMLQKRGWNCVAIHGDKPQHARIEAVDQFKSGSVPLLIATDVAARGLDIPDVEYVLNYSFPLTIEDYVHRIGRTGRGGKKGISHTFFTLHDKARAGELVNLLREAEQEIPKDLLKFGTHVKKKEHKLYGAFAKNIDMTKKATKITFD